MTLPSVEEARRRDWLRVAVGTVVGLIVLRRAGGVHAKWLESLNGAQIVIATLLARFIISNFGVITGITPPSTRSHLRSDYMFAARFFVSLYASAIACKKLPNGPVRDAASLLLVFPYLIFHDAARSLVERYLRDGSVHDFRYLWNQGADNRILHAVMKLLMPARNVNRPITLDVTKHLAPEWQHLGIVNCQLFYTGKPEQLEHARSMVLHFHGGGFVSMSPLHHQEYLSAWAKQLGVPILSVDYVKAPEHPFPAASLQVYAVYKLLLETKAACIGIHTGTMPHLVVTGDSAGGNLSASMTLRALSEGVQPPNGVMLTYPGLSFNWGAYRPFGTEDGSIRPYSSQYYYMDDPILGGRILQIVPDAYLAGNRDSVVNDMFLAPVTAPAELLARFPPTIIAVGECDPLYDDSTHFAERLRQANPDRKVHLHVEKGLSHGFLNMLSIMPASRQIVAAIAQYITTLLA